MTDYSLKESSSVLGRLTPILKDQRGNIIDGFHRKGEDSNWEEYVVESVTNDEELALARLAVNVDRRVVSAEEKTQRLADAYEARFKATGRYPTPKETAKALGVSVEWLHKYLDEKYKNPERVNAAKKGGRLRSGLTASTQTEERTAEDPEEVVVERKPPLQDVQTDETTPTPEETVQELVELRDEGLISGQQEPLAKSTWNQLPEALRSGRLLYAIFIHQKTLAECLDVLHGKPTTPNAKVSPRLSEKKTASYTTSEQLLAHLFARAGIMDYVTNEPIPVEGEDKAYIPDVLFREKKLIVEVEGEGSASAENPKREEYLTSQGYKVLHFANRGVKDAPERILRAFMEEYIPRGLVCAKCGAAYR